MTPLQRITERVGRLGHPDDPDTTRPLLSVEDFFVGNITTGSIGCNLESAPAPDVFHALFNSILQRPEVSDVRVQITMFDDPEGPVSDTVYVMTTATPEEVMSWFPEALRPDETWAGFSDQAFEPYDVPAGMHPIGCWWD